MTTKTTKKQAAGEDPVPVDTCCKNCDMAMQFQGDKNWYNCHRYPQKVRVYHSHWCGEFKAK